MHHFDFAIQQFLDDAEMKFGKSGVRPYGSDGGDPHAHCVYIEALPATISIHTQEGTLPPDQLDVQIEGVPPGDYLVSDVVTWRKLSCFISRMSNTLPSRWPSRIE